ncbi:hypothetical protein ACEQPO_05705 [Bacillus sp. SL00103]
MIKAAQWSSGGWWVTYEGGTYVVNTAPPTGTPDTSPDHTLAGMQERPESQEQLG